MRRATRVMASSSPMPPRSHNPIRRRRPQRIRRWARARRRSSSSNFLSSAGGRGIRPIPFASYHAHPSRVKGPGRIQGRGIAPFGTAAHPTSRLHGVKWSGLICRPGEPLTDHQARKEILRSGTSTPLDDGLGEVGGPCAPLHLRPMWMPRRQGSSEQGALPIPSHEGDPEAVPGSLRGHQSSHFSVPSTSLFVTRYAPAAVNWQSPHP